MFCRKTRGSHQNHGWTRERWQACDTHFHSRTAYFDFLPHGDSRDFTIYAFLHTFSIPILQPAFVSHCYRLSYVWQTPWAESPSKRQTGGNSASLSFLQMTHVTFWSARGMNAARKWRISARTVFSRVTAVTSRTADGTGLAGQGLAGRLGSCLWDRISGAWVSDVCLVHLFCPLCNPRNDMNVTDLSTNMNTLASTARVTPGHFKWKVTLSFFFYMLFAWSSIPGSRQVKLNRQHLRHNVQQNASRLDLKAEIQNLQLNKNSLSLLFFC